MLRQENTGTQQNDIELPTRYNQNGNAPWGGSSNGHRENTKGRQFMRWRRSAVTWTRAAPAQEMGAIT